jgi:hypothetical protein
MSPQLTQLQTQAHTAVNSDRQSVAATRLHGRWLVFVRVICVVLVVYTLSFFGTGLVIAFEQHRVFCTGLPCALPIPDTLVYFAVAALIFWHKSDDWMALLIALMLVLIAPLGTLLNEIVNLVGSIPVLRMLLAVSIYLAFASFLLFCFLFPNGRFVPRWSFWLVAGYLLWFAGYLLFGIWVDVVNWDDQVWYSFLGAVISVIISIVAAQIHRYNTVSSPLERQQTKWIIVGTSIAICGWPLTVFANVFNPPLILLLIPLSIGIAVLRYRLYDIDVLINRTLIYGTLTGILILVYFGLVFALQFLLRGFIGQTNDVVIVVSTLAIATLFQPFRRRIQTIIDRRFYRRKYDAARTIEAFSTTLRGEIDLNTMSEQLVAVVQETMQPAHVSLWLQRHNRQPQQWYAGLTAEQAPSRQLISPISETDLAETSEEMPRPPSRRISRRAVILGLAASGIVVASGGFAWWLLRRRLIFTYRGHSDAVYDVAWSPDGKRIASCSKDTTVQVWDASDGGHVLTYRGHTADVYTAVWSPDGKHIASCSKDTTVQVWDAADGSHVFTYRGHKDQVVSVAWSPDGTRLASGGGNLEQNNKKSDKTVQVWDASDGGHVLTYRGHTDAVEAVAWSPDGKRIASASLDKTVQVWDAADGGHVLTYRGHTDQVFTLAWSPDGKRLASGSQDTTVQVWDAVDGKHYFTYTRHSGGVLGVAWSPDSTRIASASLDNTAQVWDAADGGHVFFYNGHVITVAWSPDGKRIASSSFDGPVQIWSPG